MSLFPITAYFEGDFISQLAAVDTEDTMQEVAEKVAVQVVGRRLPRNKEANGYIVSVNNKDIPETTQLKELGLLPLQWVDIRWNLSK